MPGVTIISTEPMFELDSTKISNGLITRNITIKIKKNIGEEFKMSIDEMSNLIKTIISNYLNTYGESWKGLEN